MDELQSTLNSGIVIRNAREGDVPAVTELVSSLGYPVTVEELRPVLDLVLRTQGESVFLAELNGSKVVGLMSLLLFPSLRLRGYQLTIEELVVHPEHRGFGIGRAFLDFARCYAQKSGAVMIEVLTNRRRESFKRGFYEKNGFSISDHSVLRFDICNGVKTIV